MIKVYYYVSIQISTENYFLFVESSTLKNQQSLLLSLGVDKDNQQITFHLQIQSATQFNQFDISVDPLNFEGKWILFYTYYDLIQEQILLYFYHYNDKEMIKQFTIQDYPKLAVKMRYTLGGTYSYYTQEGKYSELVQFSGKQTNRFETLDFNLMDYINQLDDCKPQELFPEFTFYLTENLDQIQIFDGQNYQQFVYNVSTECKKLEVKGWVKLDSLPLNSKDTETVVLRITINSEFNDDTYIGDKFLFIKYCQSASIVNNYISITTYSYDFPKKRYYTSQASDTIQIRELFLQQAMTEWHYFRFEQQRDDTNFPLFTVGFPSISKVVRMSWNEPKRYFTGTFFYSFIGGDFVSSHYLEGQIQNIQLHGCYQQDTQFQFGCHYSCKSCIGPTASQCTECYDYSNRIYQNSQMNCICKLGYVDVDNNPICEAISAIYPQITLIEEQKGCDRDGFDDCDSIKCSVGYFQIENQCIKWFIFNLFFSPEQDETQSSLKLNCGQCYILPNDFKRLCTFDMIAFDFSEDKVYQFKLRERQDYSYYNLLQQENGDYYLSLCQGCLNDSECKITYFRKNELCLKCSEGCLSCQNESQCNQCMDGYISSQSLACQKCQLNCETCVSPKSMPGPLCTRCAETYFLNQQGNCQKCGAYCLSCNQQRCFTCVNNQEYFITMDGTNCAKCQISNCKYCFQFYKSLKGEIVSSTFDFNFNKTSLTSQEILTGCAYCENSLFFNIKTMQCEFVNSFNVQIAYDGSTTISGNASSSQVVASNLYVCLTGIIYDDQSLCLIHNSTYPFSIQNTDCSSILNCKSCIISSLISFSYCVICNDGYYSLLSKGSCIVCPQNCRTCIQQNIEQKDSWKFEIMAFYQYYLNANSDHYFTNYGISKDQSDYEVICTSCMAGQIIYENTCIQGCSSSCLDCQIIAGRATCVQCPSTQYGLIRSVDLGDSNCIQCSKFCQACYYYDSIQNINPFYIGDQKYQNICFREYQNRNDDVTLFNENGVLTACKQYEKCQNTLLVKYDVYCSQADLDKRNFASSNSISIDDLQKYGFDSLDRDGFYDYLNQITVRNVTFQLRMILGSANSCSFSNYSQISTQLFQNVYALQNVEIKFISEDLMKIPIRVQGILYLLNFTKVSFHNLQFISSDGSQQQVLFTNTYKPIDINLINITISSSTLNFASLSAQQVLLQNILINQVKIVKYFLFYFLPLGTLNQIKSTFQVINLQILESNILDGAFLNFYCFQSKIDSVVKISQVRIKNTYFQNSSFILNYFTGQNTCGQIYIEQFHIENTNIQYSSLILIPAGAQLKINQLKIDNCQIFSSIILALNVVDISNLQLISSNLVNSTIISNQIEIVVVKETLTMNKIQFQDNIYSNSKAFINLQTLNNVVINGIQIKENKIDYQRIDASFEDSLIYVQCNQLVIDDFYISRTYGNPEFTFRNTTNLTLKNGILEMLPQFWTKTLQPSVECIQSHLNVMEVFAIYIDGYNNIELFNISSQNMLLINYPLIMIKSKDVMQTIQTDSIQIRNCLFQDNLMLLTTSHRSTSLIHISSQQELYFKMENTIFTGNFLNEYIQDLTQYSTATILLQSISGEAKILYSQFYANVVINSTDPILLINQDTIQMRKCRFLDNNILQFSKIKDKILYSNDYFLNQLDILQYFTISSNSGNGFLIMANLQLSDIFVNNSYGVSAGGFMITAQNEAFIDIDKCEFNNIQTSLNLIDQSIGGTLCIDASKAKLFFSISNTKISNSFSRYKGGGIYVYPSKTYNFLSFNNIQVNNTISVKGMFLYLECTEQVVQSQVSFTNSNFTMSEDYFNIFIGLIKDLQITEIEGLISDNSIIELSYSDLIMVNSSLANTFLGYFLDVENSLNIYIDNLIIVNTTIYEAPIMKLSLSSVQTSKLVINKMSISNVTQKSSLQPESCSQPLALSVRKYEWKCPNVVLDDDLIDVPNTPLEVDYLECNLQRIFAASNNCNFSLILVELTTVSTAQFKNFEFLHNDCSYCTFGLIGLLSDNQQLLDNSVKIQNFAIVNNTCGIYGCITIAAEDIPQNILQQKRILQEDLYVSKSQFQIMIRQLNCMFNKAEYGGCVFVYNSLVLIIDAQIMSNVANQIGGAIFYYGENNINLYNVQVSNNTAKISGGIYTTGQFPVNLIPLKVYFQNNKGLQSNPEIQEQPRSLTISLDGGQTMLEKQIILSNTTHLIEEIRIKPFKILGTQLLQQNIHFPSGQQISSYQYFDKYTLTYIPYNLTFRLIALNKFHQREPGLKNTKCILITGQKVNQTIISKKEVTFNDTTYDYNLDDLIIYFNPQSDHPFNLKFRCPSIKVPIFNSIEPFELQYSISNYYLNVRIETFKCQLGEYYNSTSEACTLCQSDLGQYSVQENATSCKFKDEVTMKNVKSAMIELKPGFWRPFIQSEKIEQCYHLSENCEGGWNPGTSSCTRGHIGALCEQCDLYNTRLQGSYSVSGLYQCGDCQETTINIVTITFISLWALVSIILSVNSTIKHIGMFIIALKVKQYGVKVITIDSSTAILIKVFTNYLQIISTISTFSLEVPSGIASAVNSVGNPLQSMAYSLDCFLILITSIDILYFRLIWSLIMAFLYIGVFFLTNLIMMLMKKSKYNITIVTTTFIYMYIYLQPDIIGGLVSLTSFRIISGESWIQGNVAYRYQSYQHVKWLLIFVLPLLILLGLVIPIVMFLCVYVNRFKLDRIYNRCRWGYLYNEYKHETYYWETIKILQKELIIIALTFYEDYVPIKAALVFLLLFFYSFATNQYKPYMTVQMNFLDSQSTIFCSVSIVLASTIYVAQNSNLNEIVWPCYIMIGVLNGLFILKLITKIVFGYFDKLYSKIDWVKDKLSKKYPTMQKKYKFLKYVFDTRQQKQERVKRRYKMLKNHLMRQARLLIQFKKNQQFIMPEISSSDMELSSRKSSLLVNFQQEKNSLD